MALREKTWQDYEYRAYMPELWRRLVGSGEAALRSLKAALIKCLSMNYGMNMLCYVIG